MLWLSMATHSQSQPLWRIQDVSRFTVQRPEPAQVARHRVERVGECADLTRAAWAHAHGGVAGREGGGALADDFDDLQPDLVGVGFFGAKTGQDVVVGAFRSVASDLAAVLLQLSHAGTDRIGCRFALGQK